MLEKYESLIRDVYSPVRRSGKTRKQWYISVLHNISIYISVLHKIGYVHCVYIEIVCTFIL